MPKISLPIRQPKPKAPMIDRMQRKLQATGQVPAPPVDRATIDSNVHNFMGGIIAGKQAGYNVPSLRASSFPYCSILMAMADPYGEAEYRSDFYFDTGTAIHTLVQRWAARAEYEPRLWGCWRCTGCETDLSDEELQQHRPPGFKPTKACPHCRKLANPPEWQYTEVTIKWKGLSGHVDTILEVAPGQFIVVDYKTTRFRFNGSPADRGKFPYGQNKVQIQIYCALLYELFDLNVVGWALVYIDRAQPVRGPRDYHISSGMWDDIDHTGMMKVLGWANRSNIPAERILQRRLQGKLPTFDEMDEVVATRPCKTMKKWAAWMKPKFKWEQEQLNGEGICPHLQTCTCGDEDTVVDYFLDLAEDWEYGPPEEEVKR